MKSYFPLSRKGTTLTLIGTSLLATTSTAYAEFVEIDDIEEWQQVIDDETIITFASLLVGTIVTDQFADDGVVFTDGEDLVVPGANFPNDGRGLSGNTLENGLITMEFIEPIQAIAVDYPGAVQIEFWSDDELIYTSSEAGGQGAGHFFGVISDQPFDRVVLSDWFGGGVAIDDLHFSTIPGPGGAALLGIGALALTGGRRRRRDRYRNHRSRNHVL